jgi:threonine aldolase
MIQPIRPSNNVYLTLEDVKRAIVLDEDVHAAPTRVISLENTLGGSIMPLTEVRRIAAFAREHKVKLHLDGARLWNVIAAGAGTLEDFAKEFDSVSVCFSKGLGAPVGSMLVGSEAFIKRARWIRKSIGGGMRQTGPLINAARTALEEVYPKLARTHAMAQAINIHLSKHGIKTVLPVDTSIIFIDLEEARLHNDWLVEEGAKRGLKIGYGGRIVLHHQITDESIEKLKESITAIVKRRDESESDPAVTNGGRGYGSLKRL